MTPFALLSNQTRLARRPPRQVPGASAALIARLVPVRVQPRKPAQGPRVASLAHETTIQTKSGRKSPLAQAPVNIVHFPRVSDQPFGLASNGNTKAQPNAKEAIEPTSTSNNVIPANPPARKGPTAVLGSWRESLPDSQPPLESGEPDRVGGDAPHRSGADLEGMKLEDRTPETQPVYINPKLRLKELLAQNRNLPPQTVILGICEDGLPLALDLSDPAPGALLALGDMREEQMGLLRTAVASLSLRNNPRAAQFMVFSHQPDSWQAWVSQNGFDRHCIAIENAQEDALRDRILQLADWTEQRRLGQRSGPPVVLVVDTLTFLPRLAYDIRLNFDWLVKEGPQAQIWTIAAISTDLAASLGSRMLRSFQSRIIGCAKDPGFYIRLVGLDEAQARCFDQPGIFAVQIGEGWLKFHLPGTEK